MFPGPLDVSELAWLRKSTPDLVVISQGGPWDGIPWMLACHELGLGYCTVLQANSEMLWPLDEDIERTRRALRGARRVFLVSRSNRALLERQCGLRFDNAEVIANPWKVGLGAEIAWPGDDGDTQLACVARLDPRAKGQDVLLEVLSQPRWRQRPIRLNLYGTGPCEQSLKSLAALFGLEKLHFHGQVSDVQSIWTTNHALVLPSRLEGSPLAIIEAMLCGRPVIATAVAGNAELVRDGVNGFLAAAPTPVLLDEAMERAWSHRREWRGIGCKARSDVMKALPADPIGEFAQKLLGLASGT
jgi:glycosyltransferase involved in cell wall biosynthesis